MEISSSNADASPFCKFFISISSRIKIFSFTVHLFCETVIIFLVGRLLIIITIEGLDLDEGFWNYFTKKLLREI